MNLSGYTCKKCPSPRRAFETYAEEIKILENDIQISSIARGAFDIPKTKWEYTKRCTECNRLMKRFMRSKKKVTRLDHVSKHTGHDISFVTLTFPNWKAGKDEGPLDGVRWMKKQVASFREVSRGIVSGGYDFYEWTDVDHAEYNIHSHSLWVMPYWKQADFQKAWEKHLGIPKAIVHLRRTGQPWKCKKTGKWMKGDSHKDSLFYAIKYGGKDCVKGIRLSQSFGLCYGKEYAHVEQEFQAKQDET